MSDVADIIVTAACFSCGAIAFSERLQPGTLERWPDVVALWRLQFKHHLERCPGAHLEELRSMAGLVRMGLQNGRIEQPLAGHLEELLERLRVREGTNT